MKLITPFPLFITITLHQCSPSLIYKDRHSIRKMCHQNRDQIILIFSPLAKCSIYLSLTSLRKTQYWNLKNCQENRQFKPCWSQICADLQLTSFFFFFFVNELSLLLNEEHGRGSEHKTNQGLQYSSF